jgi:polyisoprenoid-binding protein YceI
MKIRLTLVLGSVVGIVGAASAAEYNQLLTDKSVIEFSYKQMNVPMDGRFARFGGAIRFDPAKPTAATVRLEIDAGSIELGALDADVEVRNKPWFNTAAFPTAQFVSNAVTPAGAGRYEVAGTLTIKGTSRPLTVPVAFRQEGSHAVFDGTFTLKRADFGIGDGIWADYDLVANDVQVTFRLLAATAAAKRQPHQL